MTVPSTSSAFAQIVITPSTPPAVNQGSTFKFTANTSVSWSMAPGSGGSIDSDGTYHAPATVTAHQSIGGCQILPNNHVINTRIDSLPVNPNNSTWISSITGFVGILYVLTTPVNYINASTPSHNMVFQYFPQNNGSFVYPPYPDGKIESGWLSNPLNYDHHMHNINPTTCAINEVYDPYPAGFNSQAPSSNAVSGVQYNNSDYALVTGGTNAAGISQMPMEINFQEWQNAVNTGGTINHAARFSLSPGVVSSSFIWPATVSAAHGGPIPYGARIRLKSNFDISGFSPQAQVLLKQAQQYGFILDDTGSTFDVPIVYTKLPWAYYNATYPEIAHSSISLSDFEFVDESSLEVSSTSGLTSTGQEAVCATNGTGSMCQQVVLTGVTIGIPSDQMYIQAGTPGQQLTYFLNGDSTNAGVTWSMNPSVGSLTSGGFYTPPSSVSSIYMGGPCGNGLTNYNPLTSTCTTTPYTDAEGNVWQSETGDDGTNYYSFASFARGSPPFPNTTDIFLYETPYENNAAGDMRFDLIVPNGTYSILGKFDQSSTNSTGSIMSLEAQGTVQYSNIDLISVVGEYQPKDYTLSATVTACHLSFVLRWIDGPYAPQINALQITQTSGAATSSCNGRPSPPTNLRAIVQ